MLEKSKKSALILSCLIVFSFSLSSAALNILLPYLLTGNINVIIENPQNLSKWTDFLSLTIILLIIIAGLIVIGACWLDKFFGEEYFDNKSVLRWALFGAAFALFIKTPDWLFGENLSTIKFFLRLVGLFVAFFLSRGIFPLDYRKESNP
jgi:hypothetical protein